MIVLYHMFHYCAWTGLHPAGDIVGIGFFVYVQETPRPPTPNPSLASTPGCSKGGAFDLLELSGDYLDRPVRGVCGEVG